MQAGLDAWLADARRTWELVGVANFQHAMFGLGDLFSGEGRHDAMGLQPGNPATVNLACGPDGEVRPCQRCGIYLVREGDVRTALLLRGASPEFGVIQVSVQIVSTDPVAGAKAAAEIRAASIEHNVFRGQVLSFGQEVFGHGQTLLQFHHRPTLTADAGHPAAGDPRLAAAAGRRGGPPQGAAARGRPAPQARAAALRAARVPARRTPSGT